MSMCFLLVNVVDSLLYSTTNYKFMNRLIKFLYFLIQAPSPIFQNGSYPTCFILFLEEQIISLKGRHRIVKKNTAKMKP